ncbi:hypothetical protein GPJ56_005721 [Histomonas meleagridis]|uniref:uncharacterized protein n=1 Tax=Histomonas meleagridis TaxID=135588 RepID=UPI0035593BBA|nr:hypothetical protein GPJ56_005721 [Histomonas meleagridis]KAH0803343.1 hypothetical protein GO595_003687 [Histomonas meleagridis]
MNDEKNNPYDTTVNYGNYYDYQNPNDPYQKPVDNMYQAPDLTPDYNADYIPPSSQDISNVDDPSEQPRKKRFIRRANNFIRKKWYRKLGFGFLCLFDVYMILGFFIPLIIYGVAKGKHPVPDIDVTIPILHWVLIVFGSLFGLSVIFHDQMHGIVFAFSIFLFLVAWVINCTIASSTEIYNAANKIYTPETYADLTKKLTESKPYVSIRVTAKKTVVVKKKNSRTTKEVSCESKKITITSDEYEDNSTFPNIILDNGTEEIYYINFDKNIKWTYEASSLINEVKNKLYNAVRAQYKSSDYSDWNLEVAHTITNNVDVVVVTNKKELSGVLSYGAKIALTVLWAPAIYCYNLAASTNYKMATVTKLNAELPKTYYNYDSYLLYC